MVRVFLEEIMKLESDSSVSNMIAIDILQRHANVELNRDEKENLFYSVNVNDVLLSDINEEDLIKVRNNGWTITEDGNKLIKKL